MNEFKAAAMRHETGGRGILSYWVRSAQSYFVMTIGMALFIVLFNSILNPISQAQFIKMITWTPFVLGLFMIINFCMTSVSSYMPLVLALGSTRRRIFSGSQTALLCLCIQNYLLYLLLAVLDARQTQAQGNLEMLLPCAGILLTAAGIGQITAVISKKGGPKRAAMMVILTMVVLIGGVVLTVFLLEKGLVDFLNMAYGLRISIFLCGSGVYLIGAVVNRCFINKMTVCW